MSKNETKIRRAAEQYGHIIKTVEYRKDDKWYVTLSTGVMFSGRNVGDIIWEIKRHR